jgi:hypothetical protein
MLNVIKQLQHFILCNMVCYGALKSNIDRGLLITTFGIFTVVKELRSKMFGQHPGYFKADTGNYRKYL